MKSTNQALWELYVEAVTRITVVDLPEIQGDEDEAMTSVFRVFSKARETLYHLNGQEHDCLAVTNLMEVLRPFLFKWAQARVAGFHKQSYETIRAFRKDLKDVRATIRRCMADIRKDHGFLDLMTMVGIE